MIKNKFLLLLTVIIPFGLLPACNIGDNVRKDNDRAVLELVQEEVSTGKAGTMEISATAIRFDRDVVNTFRDMGRVQKSWKNLSDQSKNFSLQGYTLMFKAPKSEKTAAPAAKKGEGTKEKEAQPAVVTIGANGSLTYSSIPKGLGGFSTRSDLPGMTHNVNTIRLGN